MCGVREVDVYDGAPLIEYMVAVDCRRLVVMNQ